MYIYMEVLTCEDEVAVIKVREEKNPKPKQTNKNNNNKTTTYYR